MGSGWLFLILLVLYFLPSWIGFNTKKSDGIFVLNLFLGWTLVGWVLALVWAVSAEKREPLKATPSKAAPPTGDQAFCGECGKPVRVGAKFCEHCGAVRYSDDQP